jgi:membrane protein YqaA with SNARE-associated domain
LAPASTGYSAASSRAFATGAGFRSTSSPYARAAAWFRRYGAWSLLLSWLPIIGDPLTAVAGALRVGLLRFVVLVSLGKAARYLFILGAFNWWNGT